MKLLLISDNFQIPTIFESKDDQYYFQSIQVDFIWMKTLDDFHLMHTICTQRRYHLVIGLFKADFCGPYVDTKFWANVVNVYAEDEQKNTLLSNYPQSNLSESIVNRTTSYFNVFLEFQKAVGYSGTMVNKPNLARLDTVSAFNYTFSFLAQLTKLNYYLLNYSQDLLVSSLRELLVKLE